MPRVRAGFETRVGDGPTRRALLALQRQVDELARTVALIPGVIASGWWRYSDLTTAPPAPGELRTDFADGNVATQGTIYLSVTDDDGLDWAIVSLGAGDKLAIRDQQGNLWNLTVDAVVDNTTYATITATITSSGVAPKKNARVQVAASLA